MNRDQELLASRLWSECVDPAAEYRLKTQILQNVKQCGYEFPVGDTPLSPTPRPAGKMGAANVLEKYRSMWSVARSIRPSSLIELGVFHGASADAFLSAYPEMRYLGIDDFIPRDEDYGQESSDAHGASARERRDRVLGFLNLVRRYPHVEVRIADLRQLSELPAAEAVHVDAAHDFHDQRRDLDLAMTAAPKHIYIDDYDGTVGEKAAVRHFLSTYRSAVNAVVPIEYMGGGVLIVLDAIDRVATVGRLCETRDIERMLAGRWKYHRLGHDSRTLELLPDGSIGEGRARCECNWRIDLDRGRRLFTIASRTEATCRLAQVSDGRFLGRWLTFERMPVELIRQPT